MSKQARSWRSESGQEVLEWSGLLVLVAAIFTMLFSLGIAGKVAGAVACAVDKILQSGPCAPPPAYPVSVTTKTVGYQGRFTFVDAGHQYVVTLTKLSDGTAQISLVNAGSLGLSARVGAEVELGPLGSAEAQAQAGGSVYLNGSTTWTFPTWAAAQKYWGQISNGDSTGLVVNDAVGSFPVIGSTVAGWINDVTGDRGAPTKSSLPHRYLSATAVGGGGQGDASAGAGVDAGPINADISASVSAKAGLERITSGPQKGDWQGTVQLSVDGDGSLSEALFGGHAGGAGALDGEATVTFSPNFTPLELEVTASGDGVWEAAPSSPGPPDFSLHVPGGSDSPGSGSESGNGSQSGSGAGSGGNSESGSGSGSGKSEPILDVSQGSSGGSGAGSKFVGTLDLSSDPTAQAALAQVLQGNTAGIPVLVNEMNTNGTEYTQSYRLNKSTSTVGLELNAGGGGGAHFTDGTSSACYDPPKVRQQGGPWTKAAFARGQGC